jgi:Tol biopolymer transport system component
LRQQLVTETTDEALLCCSDGIAPSDWSGNGFITYTLTTGRFPPKLDVWVLPLSGARKPFALAETAFYQASGVFSRDGRWVAYVTSDTGEPNVYVRPFLRPGGKYPVSKDGGSHPVWRADGRELFYVGADGTLMAVPIDSTGEFHAGVPQALFTLHLAAGARSSNNSGHVYAATKDGQRFLAISTREQSSQSPLTVRLNWTAAIQR